MTRYQDCHSHYGYLTRETTIARELLERHGRPRPETVKKLRNETDMPMAECADMLRCMWRDMELERLAGENVKLQDENVRLRSCLSDDADNARQIMGENAKLRELVQYIYDECYGDDWFNEQAELLGFEAHY